MFLYKLPVSLTVDMKRLLYIDTSSSGLLIYRPLSQPSSGGYCSAINSELETNLSSNSIFEVAVVIIKPDTGIIMRIRYDHVFKIYETNLIQRLADETQTSVAKANDVAEEVITSMRTVKSFACEKFEALRFFDYLNITLKIATRKSLAHVGFLWTSEVSPFYIIYSS